MTKIKSVVALILFLTVVFIGFNQIKSKQSSTETSVSDDVETLITDTETNELEIESLPIDETLILRLAEKIQQLQLVEQKNNQLLTDLGLPLMASEQQQQVIAQWQLLLESADASQQQAVNDAIIAINEQLAEKHYLQEQLVTINKLQAQVKLRQQQSVAREADGIQLSEALISQHQQWTQDVKQQLEAQQWLEGQRKLKRLLQSLEQWLKNVDKSLVLRKRSEQMRSEWEEMHKGHLHNNENVQIAAKNHRLAEKHFSLGQFEQANQGFDIAILAWAQAKQELLLEIATPEMIDIPAGSFLMGDRQGGNKKDQLPVHEQKVAAFKMAKYEASFEAYIAYAVLAGVAVPDDASWGKDKRPVINVSWLDAQQYARWLTEKTGRSFRLPSEAEWEYAARAGSETAYIWGDSVKPLANCEGCNRWNNDRTTEVGSFSANAFGLYDMSGNVWEWASDCYRHRYDEPVTEGACAQRVLRGGSWADLPPSLMVANRSYAEEEVSNQRIGFRLVEDIK